jgi:hypothetical protein
MIVNTLLRKEAELEEAQEDLKKVVILTGYGVVIVEEKDTPNVDAIEEILENLEDIDIIKLLIKLFM